MTEYLALPESRIAGLRVLSGHLTPRDFHRRPLGGWTTVTLLREPVARVLSTYVLVGTAAATIINQ